MEQIEQKQYCIDNIPAIKFGEWQGIAPNHWKGSIKIINYPHKENIFEGKFYKLIKADSTYIIKGRRHFSARTTNEEKFIPHKKSFGGLKNKMAELEKKKGIKAVKPIFKENKIEFIKRHFEPKYGLEDNQSLHIKTFFPNGNCQTLKEMTLEQNICGKKRIPNISVMRNNLPISAPGDKQYKNPEYETNFFKEGGLISGSSNFLNYNKNVNKQSYNFYQTLNLNIKTLDPNKTWFNKVKTENLNFDSNYVKTLSTWDEMMLKENLKSQIDKKIISNNSQRGLSEPKDIKQTENKKNKK